MNEVSEPIMFVLAYPTVLHMVSDIVQPLLYAYVPTKLHLNLLNLNNTLK